MRGRKASVAASRFRSDIEVPPDHQDHAPGIVDKLNEMLDEMLDEVQVKASATLMWQDDAGERKPPFIRVVGNSVDDLKTARNTIRRHNLIPWMQNKPHAGMRAVEYKIPASHRVHMTQVVANLNQAILSARARIEPGQDGQFILRIEADSPMDIDYARDAAYDWHIVPWLL